VTERSLSMTIPPAVKALVREALGPLHEAFQVSAISVFIRSQETPDGVLYKVVVLLPNDYAHDPEVALHRFDDAWWLNHCQQSEGLVVFDYEVETCPCND